MTKSVRFVEMVGAGVTAVALTGLAHATVRLARGNQPQYAPGAATLDPTSPLYGKRIVFLGSSITYGAAAHGRSFVDDLAASDGVIAGKLAISGTTLAGHEASSYVSRLAAFHPAVTPDAFVCQLSTNDGRQGKPLGMIAEPGVTQFDADTTIGAIETIVSRVQRDWGCPILFYTCLLQPDADYSALIAALRQLQAKYHFAILDLHGDAALASATKQHPGAMFDDAHPTQLGYSKLWTPLFRQALGTCWRELKSKQQALPE
ncbi:SGNH/GDSL hydrolase family protein [Lacticaseibacillus nasuensis]|uniref:SGNH/GDSL hydrolase family protein n=1 Tax=Lacticaseibacillus nasuensis TaxID=944671 RepID=UPI0006D21CDC|nr:SGNH/GDSL hydrolase family protein [Lacticaseibacillus nasuensis]